MSRLTLQEALRQAKEYSQFRPTFGPKSARSQIKRVEHAAGTPVMRRQRIFNNAVVQVLDEVVQAADRSDAIVSGVIAHTTHQEGIAALRRDLVALQQEVAALRQELAESQAG